MPLSFKNPAIILECSKKTDTIWSTEILICKPSSRILASPLFHFFLIVSLGGSHFGFLYLYPQILFFVSALIQVNGRVVIVCFDCRCWAKRVFNIFFCTESQKVDFVFLTAKFVVLRIYVIYFSLVNRYLLTFGIRWAFAHLTL